MISSNIVPHNHLKSLEYSYSSSFFLTDLRAHLSFLLLLR
nr:MAG TPA: hypothetical protein [Caudoviricetes sp.]